jgi:hypothetical protein
MRRRHTSTESSALDCHLSQWSVIVFSTAGHGGVSSDGDTEDRPISESLHIYAAPGSSEPVDETFLHEVVRRAPRPTPLFPAATHHGKIERQHFASDRRGPTLDPVSNVLRRVANQREASADAICRGFFVSAALSSRSAAATPS